MCRIQPNWRTGSAATWCARCTRAGNGSGEAAGAAAGSTKNGSPAWRGFRIGLAAGAPAQSAFATTFLTPLRAGALAGALAALATGAAALPLGLATAFGRALPELEMVRLPLAVLRSPLPIVLLLDP